MVVIVERRVRRFVRIGLIGLLGLLTACTSTTSREAAIAKTNSPALAPSDVAEAADATSATSRPENDTPPPSTGTPVMAAASCAFEYSPSTLAQRTWAFDGTLLTLGSLQDSHLGTVSSATFSVNRWYRGGNGSQVTVQFEMGPISEFVPEAEAGARFLVTGEPRWGGQPLDDPVAWGCGFTQLWTADRAESWANALGPTAWQIDGVMQVSMQIPDGWVLDPHLVPLSDTDTANGLFLLQRWMVPGSSGIVALSVQRDPGDDAPVNTTPAYRVVDIGDTSWRLVDVGLGDGQSVVAFARLSGYLFEITGTGDIAESLARSLVVSPLSSG